MRDFIEFLDEGLELANQENAGEGLEATRTRSLRQAGYMTNDKGLEVKMADGRTFILTVQEK